MKNLIPVFLLPLSVGLVLSACRKTSTSTEPGLTKSLMVAKPTELTSSKAQAAVQKWINEVAHGGSVTVLQIHMTTNNTAEVRLRFSGLLYSGTSAMPNRFSGKGFAVFTHYVDRRWALTEVGTLNGSDSIVQNTLIVVN